MPNIQADLEYSEFHSYLQSAEQWIQREVLGKTIYDKMDAGTYTAVQFPEMFRTSRSSIVLKAYEMAIPFMDLIQTSSGFGVISDQNRAPASQNRVDRLIAQTKLRLGEETEYLLDYLEDTNSLHTDWKGSNAFTILSDCLIRTVREFKRCVGYDGTRKDFLMLKPLMVNLTVLKFHPMISREYTEELILKLNTLKGSIPAADLLIIPSMQKALANYCLDNNYIAGRLLDDVVTIMDNNIEDYPTYADSPEKELKDDPGFENDEDDPIFIFKAGL